VKEIFLVLIRNKSKKEFLKVLLVQTKTKFKGERRFFLHKNTHTTCLL
jgi:hypothetical protein